MTFVALLRKDWRVYRTVIAGAAILAAAPYVILLLLQWAFPMPSGNTRQTYLDTALNAATMGFILTILMSAVFGGCAFAVERRERSAEFLAMFPVKRSSIALAKLIVSAVCLASMWGVHLAVIALLNRYGVLAGGRIDFVDVLYQHATGVYAVLLVMSFAVAWLFSSFMHNASLASIYAIGGSIAALFAIGLMIQRFVNSSGATQSARTAQEIHIAYAVALGVAFLVFISGTLHYLRRVAP